MSCSVVIPARDETHLQRTVDGILSAAIGEVEVIPVLDGWWPEAPLRDDGRVKVVHFSEPRGMRSCINAGARIAQGDFLMKCDAHCSFDKGFDVKLIEDCEPDWTMVPIRYSLDAGSWEPKFDKKYEFEYISSEDLKGRRWPEYSDRVNGQEVVELMTFQGSCWFMKRDRFWELDGEDDVNYGSMGREAQEISLKSWLSGGKCVLSRKTWYAHWSKSREDLIRSYKAEKEKSVNFACDFWFNNRWPKRARDLSWLVDRFAPVPTWDGDRKEEFVPTEQILWKKPSDNPVKVIKKIGWNRASLYRYFASLGFEVGAEVGVQRGRNAWVMFQNIPHLKLYLVDPYRDNPDTERQWGQKIHDKAKKIAHERLKGLDVEWVEDFSVPASLKFADNSLDFVYVDGEHSYDYVMMDDQLWSRKVRPGGIVSGHDYHFLKSNKFKVEDAVNDFARAHGIILYITDEQAKELPGDGYASWFWFKP